MSASPQFFPNPKISNSVRLRYAPSPTGYLHVGGARTALYNYLYAKKMKGQFVLRIEDTDEARSTEASLKMMIEDLVWLGLNWDEGPDPVTLKDLGSVGPYKQSDRKLIYKDIADQIMKSGRAYYCFLTEEEIEKQREEAMKMGQQPQVKSPYRDWSVEKALEKIKEGGKAVVRFNTKGLEKDYVLTDIVRGEVRLPSDMVGDFVLLRSGGVPVYNFCCVVDDHLMKMTHILRAEEHLPNTLRQMMIYEAMKWEMPHFGHLSLVLDEDRKKLSKRQGATSCTEFKNEGYLPEALNNYIALLGWSHPQDNKEVMSMSEMQDSFSLDRFNSSGAVFDIAKLKWMNSVHLRAKSDREIWTLLLPFLQKADLDLPTDTTWQDRSVQVFRPKMETLWDGVELYRPLSKKHFAVAPESSEALGWESTKAVFAEWKSQLEQIQSDYLTEAQFSDLEAKVKEKTGAKGKNLFQALRVAVIGKPHGPELKILVPLMPRKELIERVSKI